MDRAFDAPTKSSLKDLARLNERDRRTDSAASGGGFAMDIEAMRRLLPKWRAIADKLRSARSSHHVLQRVAKPAEDHASGVHHEGAESHTKAYFESLDEQVRYADAYADSLQKAIHAYEEQDSAVRNSLHRHGGGA